MTTRKTTKRALWMSVLSLVLCIGMLAGTTFAWFTDSVSSENNIITAGNLDIELYWSTTADDKDWHKVGENTNIFKDDALWEPGYTEVVYLKVVNEGSLALKYWLGVNIVSETTGANQQGKILRLSDYIQFGVVESATKTYYDTREAALAAVPADGYKAISAGYSNSSKLWPETNEEGLATEEYATLVVTMPEDVGDEANHNGVIIPSITIGLDVFATQLSYEEDSYGSDYDIGAPWAGEIDISWYNTTDTAFVLTTPQQLAGLAEIVNSGADNFSGKLITLGADIDLNNIEWTPIGRFYQKANNTTYTFSGTFDGDDHTVSNLQITGVNNYVGLFGYTRSSKGEIKNLTVENAKVSGRERVGTVVGQAYDTKMTNITVTGHVEVNGKYYVGGVVGRGGASNDWTDITVNVINNNNIESYVKADATNYIPGNSKADENGYVHDREYVGGVLGHTESGGRIRKNITSNINVYGYNSYIGGAIGIAQYNDIFENVTVTGKVIGIGETTHTGGIAGGWQNNAETFLAFTDCSFTGTVSNDTGDLTGCELHGGEYFDESNGSIVVLDGKDPDGNWAAINATYLANALKQGGTVKAYYGTAKPANKIFKTINGPLNGVSLEVPASETVTLDLNGGTIQGDFGNAYLAVLVNNGTLTVKNGNLNNSRANLTYNASGCSVILNNGTLTLQDVTIQGSGWTSNQVSVCPGYAIDNRNKLTVEAGTTIKGGNGIKTEGAGAETVINGGTITIPNWTCNVKDVPVHAHAIYAVAGAKVTVNSGNFSMGTFTNKYKKATTCSGLLCVDSTASLDITGGTFNADPSAFLSDDYKAYPSEGKYVVARGNALVTTADELVAAVEGAENNDIILVYEGNYTVNKQLQIDNKTLTIIGIGDVTITGTNGHLFQIRNSDRVNLNTPVAGTAKTDNVVTFQNVNIGGAAKAGILIRNDVDLILEDVTFTGTYSWGPMQVENYYSDNDPNYTGDKNECADYIATIRATNVVAPAITLAAGTGHTTYFYYENCQFGKIEVQGPPAMPHLAGTVKINDVETAPGYTFWATNTAELIDAIKATPAGKASVIYLADGTYDGNIDITLAAMGAQYGDVVIKAAEGAKPVITGTVTLGYYVSGTGAAKWKANVTFEGITFNHAENAKHSINVQSVNGITLDNCKIIGDGEYGIESPRGNDTGASLITGCIFENAAMQLLGKFTTGLVIDGCEFNNSRINVQAGDTLTIQNCTFNSVLTDANNGDSFYVIRTSSTGTPITVKDCVINVDSTVNGVAVPAATKAFAVLHNRHASKAWTIENVTITMTDAAVAQPNLHVILTAGGAMNTTNLVVVTGDAVSAPLTMVADGLYKDAEGNYYVYNAAGLKALNEWLTSNAYAHAIWGKTYNIMADIDANGIVWNCVDLNTPNNDCEGFTVNGNSYTISNLTISGSGMFSSTANGKNTAVPTTFKDLTFDNAVVTGGYHTGIVWAQMYGDIVLDNVHVIGSTITGTCNVGALVGRNGDEGASTVAYKNCSVTNTTITATGNGDPNGASVFQGSALTINNGANVTITFENCTQSGNALNSADGQVGGGIYAWWNASTNETGVVNDFN